MSSEGTPGNDDHHALWGYAERAFLWHAPFKPRAFNFHPHATEMHGWLRQEGFLSIFSDSAKDEPGAASNPYTYSLSTIGAVLARYIDDAYTFAHSQEETTPLDAEIQRVRLYSALVLHTARFCEAAIKQLLYCTLIPEKEWKKSALGGLLSTPCRPCKAKGTKHNTSWLGSLAHRYFLCREFDHCAIQHLSIVNRRRNIEAAHSGSVGITTCSVGASRSRLDKDARVVIEEFLHLVSHISELEQAMIFELTKTVEAGPEEIKNLGLAARAKYLSASRFGPINPRNLATLA